MTLQDFFPYDSTVLGMENLYNEVGKDSFWVNSKCVVAKDKILTKGKHYLIFDIQTKSDIKMTEVILADLFYYKDHFHLIVQDIRSKRIFHISLCLECPEKYCMIILVDIDYFIDRMEDRVIKDYCGCDNNKGQPAVKGIAKAADDLLEFNF
jgi:hypothetical protein